MRVLGDGGGGSLRGRLPAAGALRQVPRGRHPRSAGEYMPEGALSAMEGRESRALDEQLAFGRLLASTS